jgi:hypothetical protein
MSEYIKALSVNTGIMVYARQVFCEPGMLPGYHLARMYDELEVIPDSGWIVWFPNLVEYDTMPDQIFRETYVPYADMPEDMRAVCDARPDYEDWLRLVDAGEGTIP